MKKVKIEIKNRWTGKVLFEYESEDNTIKKTLLQAIAEGSNLRGSNLSDSNLSDSDLSGSDLSGSDLSGSNLSGSNLRGSNLRGSNLSGSNLSDSNLSGSNLSGSNLSGSNLRGSNLSDSNLRDSNLSDSDLSDSNLSPIRDDFFLVLLRGIAEIPKLKKNVIEGNINGSTYEGECACLSGTLFNAATENNGKQEAERKGMILSVRDANRPIERFFLGIKKGDTPENNQFSKIVLEWIIQFEFFISSK
jgi:uncharacterized protein YjbI with pentapeptide repeats